MGYLDENSNVTTSGLERLASYRSDKSHALTVVNKYYVDRSKAVSPNKVYIAREVLDLFDEDDVEGVYSNDMR